MVLIKTDLIIYSSEPDFRTQKQRFYENLESDYMETSDFKNDSNVLTPKTVDNDKDNQ